MAAEEPCHLEEAVYVPLVRMHQMALLFRFPGWSPPSVSAQEQMLQELAMPRMVGNYQACDCQNLDHYSLIQITLISTHKLQTTVHKQKIKKTLVSGDNTT